MLASLGFCLSSIKNKQAKHPNQKPKPTSNKLKKKNPIKKLWDLHPYRVRTYRVLINAIWSWLTLRYFCAGSLQAFVLQRATMHTLCLMSLAQLSSATTSALPTPQFLNLLTSDCQCKISEDLLLKNNTSKGSSLVIGQLYIYFYILIPAN